MAALLASGGVAVDFANLVLRRSEAEAVSNAAGRAAACHAWDRSLLCAALQDLELFPAGTSLPVDASQASVINEAAQSIASQNQVNNQAVTLTDANIAISGGGSGMTFVSVTSQFSGINGISRLFTNKLNSDSFDVGATSTYVMDQKIYGFRPTNTANVMLAPLMVDYSLTTWEADVCDGFAILTVTIDNASGSEIEGNARLCTLRPVATPSSGMAVPFSTSATDPTGGQVLTGLNIDHLMFLGDQFSMFVANLDPFVLHPLELESPAGDSVSATVLSNINADLQAIAAAPDISLQRRIIPLGSEVGGVRQIHGFVAGRIVASSISSTDETTTLTVTIVPTLFKTVTGLTHSHQTPNPWLGKVYRTHSNELVVD